MFHLLWIVLVPFGVAFLRGRSPRWSHGSSHRATRARGISALLLHAGSVTLAVLGLAGVSGGELLRLRIAAGPLLILVARGPAGMVSLTDRPPSAAAKPRPSA